MVFFLSLLWYCLLYSLFGPRYLVVPPGGTVPPEKVVTQLEGEFISIFFRTMFIPSNFLLHLVSSAAVPDGSVPNILRRSGSFGSAEEGFFPLHLFAHPARTDHCCRVAPQRIPCYWALEAT